MFAYSIYGIFLKEYWRRGRKCTDKLTFSHLMKIRKSLYVLTFPFGTPKSCIVILRLNRWVAIDNFSQWLLLRIWFMKFDRKYPRSSGDLFSQNNTRHRFEIWNLVSLGWLRVDCEALDIDWAGRFGRFGARSHKARFIRWTHVLRDISEWS